MAMSTLDPITGKVIQPTQQSGNLDTQVSLLGQGNNLDMTIGKEGRANPTTNVAGLTDTSKLTMTSADVPTPLDIQPITIVGGSTAPRQQTQVLAAKIDQMATPSADRPATSDEINSIYQQNFGRTPTASELSQQLTNQVGINNLTSWALQNKVSAPVAKPAGDTISTPATTPETWQPGMPAPTGYYINAAGTGIVKQPMTAADLPGYVAPTPAGGAASTFGTDPASLATQAAGIGQFTPAQQAQIEAAGWSAGGQYDPLIRQAESAKEQGMPKAIVGAGEAGGFMNTQLAGAAALVPTQGGDWVGAGGELQRIQSVYDENISNLQSQKNTAIQQAKMAMQDYLRTGQQQSFDNANKLYQQAVTNDQNAQTLAMNKAQAIQNLKSGQLQIDATTAQNLAPFINSQLTADPTANAKIINDMATQNNINPATLYSGLFNWQQAQKSTDILNSGNVANILKNTTEGGTVNVPGIGQVKVLGTSANAPTTLSAGGSVYQWSDGKWTNTGIKDNALTPANIISALQAMGNPDLISQYLSGQGIMMPSTGTGTDQGSVSYQNNNPLNIKMGEFASGYGATQGTTATDGGAFAKFPDVQTGLQAAQDLLTGSSYNNLTLDEAMKKWSNSGYGADVAPELDPQGKTKDYSPDQLDYLMGSMINREGWKEPSQSIDATYDDFLQGRTPQQVQAFNSLSSIDKSNIAQLVNGDVLLSDLVTTRGVQGSQMKQKLLEKAKKIDPGFSENINKIRYAFNQKWNSTESSVGKNRTSINTALGHLADVFTASKSLAKNTIQKMNSIGNVLTANLGDPAVTDFRLGISALAGELASVYKNGTAPTDEETEQWRNAIADNFSKGQFQGVFDMAAKLLSSKVTAVRYQYKLTMGKEFNQTVIDPDKKQMLLDAGINPEAIVKENVPGQESDSYELNGVTYIRGEDGLYYQQ